MMGSNKGHRFFVQTTSSVPEEEQDEQSSMERRHFLS